MIVTVKNYAENLFADSTGSHDWEHTRRVFRLCERIGRLEGADMDVLRIAAYLHDIGRCYQDASSGMVCHARKGAEMTAALIKKFPLTSDQKTNIVHCIRSHRFRDDTAPKTIEAESLFDADKLDAIGAVGVARAYLFAGEVGACLHNPDIRISESKSYSENDTGYREFKVKLRKIKDRMITETGKRLAEERHRFMEIFFKRFLAEYEGRI